MIAPLFVSSPGHGKRRVATSGSIGLRVAGDVRL